MTCFLSPIWVLSVDITVSIDTETGQKNSFGKFNFHENEKLTKATWKFNSVTVIGPSLVITTLFNAYPATRIQARTFSKSISYRTLEQLQSKLTWNSRNFNHNFFMKFFHLPIEEV